MALTLWYWCAPFFSSQNPGPRSPSPTQTSWVFVRWRRGGDCRRFRRWERRTGPREPETGGSGKHSGPAHPEVGCCRQHRGRWQEGRRGVRRTQDPRGRPGTHHHALVEPPKESGQKPAVKKCQLSENHTVPSLFHTVESMRTWDITPNSDRYSDLTQPVETISNNFPSKNSKFWEF